MGLRHWRWLLAARLRLMANRKGSRYWEADGDAPISSPLSEIAGMGGKKGSCGGSPSKPLAQRAASPNATPITISESRDLRERNLGRGDRMTKR